jgi:hypothetical protein
MRNTNWQRWSVVGGLLLLAAGYALWRQRRALAPQPKEIAPGVWWLEMGRGFRETNVYFVRSGLSWVLIDGAWPSYSQVIKEAAESVFGAGAPGGDLADAHPCRPYGISSPVGAHVGAPGLRASR